MRFFSGYSSVISPVVLSNLVASLLFYLDVVSASENHTNSTNSTATPSSENSGSFFSTALLVAGICIISIVCSAICNCYKNRATTLSEDIDDAFKPIERALQVQKR